MSFGLEQVLLMLAGAGMFLDGASGCVRARRLRDHGVRAEGTIIRFAVFARAYQPPVVEFTARGVTYRFTSRTAVGPRTGVGDRVPVRYSESKPARAIIDTLRGAYAGPGRATLGGLFLALAATVL